MHLLIFPILPVGLTPRDCNSEKEEETAGKRLPALTPVPDCVEFGKNLAKQSRQFAASANRRFKFHKRRQLFVRTHNETPSVVTVCISNEARSALGIND
jgi:hypothetical protein